jgi:leader peptidase (prepilin peptidase) / N-methyltransferase
MGTSIAVAALVGVAAGIVASRLAAAWAATRAAPTPNVHVPPGVTVLLHGVVFAVLVWRWGALVSTVPLLGLAWVVLTAADVDLRVHAIPDRLTLPAPLVLGFAVLVVSMVGDGVGGGVGPGSLIAAGVTALTLPAALLLTSGLFRRLRGEAGVGLGDVKLAVTIGLVLGWRGPGLVVLALLVAFLSSAMLVLVLLATRRLELGGRMPFGPHLAIGTVVALAGGEPTAAWLGAVLLG